MEKHSIQLLDIGVKELRILTESPPEHGEEIDASLFSLGVGYTDLDEETNIINVGLKFQNQKDEESVSKIQDSNLSELVVEVVGIFQVDTKEFPPDKIEHWAQNNAPYILIPYLREYVYSLTQRCGFKPLVLPLFKVPTLRVEN